MVLKDEPYTVCAPYLCHTPEQAESLARNQIEIGKWMDEASNIIRYYQTEIAKPNASK